MLCFYRNTANLRTSHDEFFAILAIAERLIRQPSYNKRSIYYHSRFTQLIELLYALFLRSKVFISLKINNLKRHKKTLDNQGFIRVIKSITYDLPYKPDSRINTFALYIICACVLDRPCAGWEIKWRHCMFAGLHVKLHLIILLFIRTVGKNYNYFQFIFAQYKTVHISLRSRSSGRVKARRPD